MEMEIGEKSQSRSSCLLRCTGAEKPEPGTAHMFRTSASTSAVSSIITTSRLSYCPSAIRALSDLPVYTKALPRIKSLRNKSIVIMADRRSHSTLARESSLTTFPIPATRLNDGPPPKRRTSQRKALQAKPEPASTNPDKNPSIVDGPEAIRASPDAEELEEWLNAEKVGKDIDESDSSLSDLSDTDAPVEAENPKANPARQVGVKSPIFDSRTNVETAVPAITINQQRAKGHEFLDPEAEGEEEAGEEEIQAALSRPPPVNSDYLPLPWKGRLGYVSSDFFIASLTNFKPGLFVYLSTIFESAGLQLSNMPHCIHSRKSTPTQGS